MTSPVAGRSPVVRSLGAALITLAISVALIGVIELSLLPASGFHPVWALDLFTVGGLIYATAGLVAWWRRPSNGLGVIMFGGALTWLATALANTAVILAARRRRAPRRSAGCLSRCTCAVSPRYCGIGGAAPGSGLGLRSLADRIDTLGGRLLVTSQADLGTSLRAELPCGS